MTNKQLIRANAITDSLKRIREELLCFTDGNEGCSFSIGYTIKDGDSTMNGLISGDVLKAAKDAIVKELRKKESQLKEEFNAL